MNRPFFAFAITALALATGCNKATTAAQSKEADPAKSAPRNELEITANDNLRQRLKIGEPAWANVGTTLEVAARLEVDETRITRIGSPVMGRITAVYVHPGELVHAGQLLAQLNSTGLSDAQLTLLKSLSQKQVAQRAVERAQTLVNSEVIGRAELQRREAELNQIQTELDVARNELAVLGMAPEAIADVEKSRAINSNVRILATAAGTVLERHITVGQVIQPADSVFEIADLSSVWMIADVPEQNIGNVRTGEIVEAELSAFPGRKLRGKLSFVSAMVNPETRTVRVRMDLPNADGRYKPAMLATMTLRDQTERKLVVPSSAVVRENDVEHVFIDIGSSSYVMRPVTLAEEQAGSRVLVSGVNAGEKIVLDGAFHLNNERRRQLLRGSEGE